MRRLAFGFSGPPCSIQWMSPLDKTPKNIIIVHAQKQSPRVLNGYIQVLGIIGHNWMYTLWKFIT